MKPKFVFTLLAIVIVFGAAFDSTRAQGTRNPKEILDASKKPGAQPDLIIESATFYFHRAVVRVKNVGPAASGKANVLLELFATYDPASKVTNKFNKTIPPLPSGLMHTVEFDLAPLTLANHGRRVMVDNPNLAAARNGHKNELFSKSDPQAESGDFTASGNADLALSDAKFFEDSSVKFCVKNIGSTISSSYRVRITIYNGPNRGGPIWIGDGPHGGKTNPFELSGDGLKPGEIRCDGFAFETYGENPLVNKGRLVEVIPDNPLLDADKTNNSYFSPGIADLWKSPK